MHIFKNNPATTQDSLLRLPQVKITSGLSRSSIYQNIKNGDFPTPIKIGKRAVAWRESDIQKWLNSRPLVSLNRPNGEML